MSMLKEAIEKIVALGTRAAEAQIVRLPGDARAAFVVHDGKLVEHVLPPELRAHTVFTADDICAAVQVATAPMLFHSNEKVVLLLDHLDRRERVTMPLTLATTFVILSRLTTGACTFQPKELAKLLRVDLAGTNYPDDLVPMLRKLKWRSTQEVRQSFGHGRESIGKDVEAELQADVELPEFVEVDTPVYSNPGEERTHTVRCIVDPQPIEQRIAFRPVPGELEEALQLTQMDLRMRLIAALPNVPMFHGVP